MHVLIWKMILFVSFLVIKESKLLADTELRKNILQLLIMRNGTRNTT